MDEPIYKCCLEDFPMDEISLANPQGLQGGAYLSKLKVLGKRLVLQTPRCTTKNGIHKTDKKIYCDLMFDTDHDEVREFFRQLSDKIKNLIFDKKDIWFHNEMDMDTIDYHWQNILRPYKGTKYLLRCNIRKPHRSKVSLQPSVQIYDEDETLLGIDDVIKGSILMGLLHLNGLKFTSQSFSVDFYLEQAMVLKARKEDKKCRIQIDNNYKNRTAVVADSPVFADSDSDNSPKSIQQGENNIIGTVDTSIRDINSPVDNKTNVSPKISEEQNSPKSLDLLSPISPKNTHIDQKLIVDDVDKKKDEMVEDKTGIVADQTAIVADNLAETNNESLEKTDILSEVTLDIPSDSDSLKLKKPNEVYMEIYKEVRRRAKEARKKAIEAYLEVKRIKSLYMLDEIEVEESEDDDDILESLGDEVELVQ